jgi:hypothetical protein
MRHGAWLRPLEGIADSHDPGLADQRAHGEAVLPLARDRPQHTQITLNPLWLRAGHHHAPLDVVANRQVRLPESDGRADQLTFAPAFEQDI